MNDLSTQTLPCGPQDVRPSPKSPLEIAWLLFYNSYESTAIAALPCSTGRKNANLMDLHRKSLATEYMHVFCLAGGGSFATIPSIHVILANLLVSSLYLMSTGAPTRSTIGIEARCSACHTALYPRLPSPFVSEYILLCDLILSLKIAAASSSVMGSTCALCQRLTSRDPCDSIFTSYFLSSEYP